MGDRVPPSATLGDVLAARRRRRFVGRSAELELVRAALDSPRPPFSVLYLYGPGGIGKTSLLDEVADLAVGAGSVLVRLDGACRRDREKRRVAACHPPSTFEIPPTVL